MTYKNTVVGRFVSRPNRFIAEVEINGAVEVCHVKNTGRCRELLVSGVEVVLECTDNPERKTKYDLIVVRKGDMLINIDSQAPNKAVGEWISDGGLVRDVTLIRPECRYGSSRFDFYVEAGERRIFAEVKGVTLETGGVFLFPDAPTERGVKHIRELIDAKENGYEAYAIFVIQAERCKYFTPNKKMHPEFSEALKEAEKRGVEIRAVCCRVERDSMKIIGDVPVVIED